MGEATIVAVYRVAKLSLLAEHVQFLSHRTAGKAGVGRVLARIFFHVDFVLRGFALIGTSTISAFRNTQKLLRRPDVDRDMTKNVTASQNCIIVSQSVDNYNDRCVVSRVG